MIYTRFVYIVAAAVVAITGLASRKYREQMPEFLANYAGDTLWGLMLFLLVGAVLASRPLVTRAVISMALAFLVELSQLYHAPWIDSIRASRLGGLVLGFGFLWSDLVCYSVGISMGTLVDWLSRRAAQPSKEKPIERQDVVNDGDIGVHKSSVTRVIYFCSNFERESRTDD